jgi:hypothetical protein
MTVARATLAVAATLLVALLVGLLLSTIWERPSALEVAVEREWQGEIYSTGIVALAGGDPEATARTRAEEVSCKSLDRVVDGVQVERCEITHCDHDRASFFDCPDTTSPACAALVEGELVLVSETWRTGPRLLQDRIAVGECAL